MKIAVLLSGGVDSSVSLALLKEKGYDVTAFYIKIWLEDELSFLGQCPWEEDLEFAKGVCEKLDVPLKVVSLQKEYYQHVVSYVIDELKKGRTPSPDIFCNERIKFGVFLERFSLEFDKVASGHYAQIEQIEGKPVLKISPDPVKDQSYFLAHLKRQQLEKILFPIGGFYKKQVRELAEKYDLPNKNRKDSQGICFLGKIKYHDFVKHHLGEKRGDILEESSGKKMGEHEGYWYYTIGQRQGIGLSGGPWYVVKKDLEKNIVYISRSYNKDEYARNSYTVGEFSWLLDPPSKENLRVKLRHGPTFHQCRLVFSNQDKQEAQVYMDQSDPGIAPGQFTVFYDGDICLGCAKNIR
ncbi:MAG: tRNA 2-thiouridine(34) synthase MnmA [Candidatus Brocadiae bacterium]|nr:tRNA 2-thiouridine(34) synthase MnmA [Candidatus Brocadiia bacterium]